MTRVRAAVAWALLVPIGGALMGLGIMLASPGLVLAAVGLLLWTTADRLLTTHPTPDTDWSDEQWRSYLNHPSTQGMAQRRIRGEDR